MFDVAGVFAGMFVLAAFVILIDMRVAGRAPAAGVAPGRRGEQGLIGHPPAAALLRRCLKSLFAFRERGGHHVVGPCDERL